MLQHYSQEAENPRGRSTEDIELGKRLRFCRAARSMSQTELGDRLGITFQQVQKYENGLNRIAATRLATIARILQVPVSDLLPDASETRALPVISPEALELASTFERLPAQQRSELKAIARILVAHGRAIDIPGDAE